MKLKSIKKILDRIDPEIYPLWLENVLCGHLFKEKFQIDWEKGNTTLIAERILIDAFNWVSSSENYFFWHDRHEKLCELIPWYYLCTPYSKPSKFTKFWYFRKKDGRTCIAYLIDGIIMVYAGCFVGTISEFESAANERYHSNEERNYAKHILWLRELELKYK